MTDAEGRVGMGERVRQENGTEERDRVQCVREQVRRLAGQVEATYRALGILLKEIRDKEYWRTYGYASFEDYCENEVGYKDRKVRLLIATHEAFERCGVEEHEAQDLPVSKAHVIAPVLTAVNKQDWLEKAHRMDTRALKREVAKAQGRPISDEAPRPWGVQLFEDQRLAVEHAMRLAALAAGTDVRSVMLVTICQEFIAEYSHLDQDPVEAPHAG